ncbi:MAG: class I poly(R)-hydroxyalkanoic acid synthase [Alphaproteobacteria bacterium]|nr:class I poly(R)-hydroxyalkanoic acid synthase [Alphaproteobacteria bacterium]
MTNTNETPPTPFTEKRGKSRGKAGRASLVEVKSALQTGIQTAELPPIPLDPIEWSRILMRVCASSQELIADYLIRTHGKPHEMQSFSSKPIMDSLLQLSSRILSDPMGYAHSQMALWQHYADLSRLSCLRLMGLPFAPVAEAPAGDKRFKAPDWQRNWMFDVLKQAYLSTTDEANKLIHQETAHVDGKAAKKIDFYMRLLLDAVSPNNFWLTNPEVLRATWDSKGENLIKGLENLLRDMERGHGMLRISMSDSSAFQPGRNIAITPGKVVYQNDLMQLIQYAPSTSTVKRTPFLIIPPWINKYYILDLREKNSFIRYLVSQGHTVFCISWVNATKDHASVQFDDYMEKGALSALTEIKRLTGEDEANVLGYCIGGTLLASTQAYLATAPEARVGLPKIASSTYLVTMVDFAQVGDMSVFIDEEQIGAIEKRMKLQGFMDAGSMMLTFSLLRDNDLVWPFVINNYLLGREPTAFDILYWNADGTNLPAAMQSYYLRNMYLYNKLIQPNALKMKNMPIDLSKITTPSFLLAAHEDHIAPWKSTYAATQIYKGPVTFVLAGSGHIAGVVNHPDANKYNYWTNAKCPANPDEWFEKATPHQGSWWPEWIKWLEQYAGGDIAPRQVTEGIEDAPGSYVKVRAV